MECSNCQGIINEPDNNDLCDDCFREDQLEEEYDQRNENEAIYGNMREEEVDKLYEQYCGEHNSQE